MKFRLVVNSIAVGGLFALWQRDYLAGLFAVVVCGFILSLVDYVKGQQ